jgi:hypothetical protein
LPTDGTSFQSQIKRDLQPNPLANGAVRGVGLAPPASVQGNNTKSTILRKDKSLFKICLPWESRFNLSDTITVLRVTPAPPSERRSRYVHLLEDGSQIA